MIFDVLRFMLGVWLACFVLALLVVIAYVAVMGYGHYRDRRGHDE